MALRHSRNHSMAIARLWLAIVFLCFATIAPPASAATGQPATTNEAETYLLDAEQRFQDGDYRGAVIQLRNVLQGDPKNHYARILLGRSYLELQNGKAAEDALLYARRNRVDYVLIAVPLAKAYRLQRKSAELHQNIHLTGSRDVDTELLIIQGEDYLDRRRYNDANKSFEHAKSISPLSVGAHLGLSKVAAAKSDFTTAAEILTQTLEIAPDHPEVWYSDGEMSTFNGEFEAALASYSQALELAPDHVRASVGRAGALLDLNRPEEALSDLERVRSRALNDPRAAFLEAIALSRLDREDEAKNALTRATDLVDSMSKDGYEPEPRILLLGGAIHFAHKNYNRAKLFLERYHRDRPGHVGARLMLASLEMNSGQPERALALAEPVAESFPERHDVWAVLGSVYLRTNRLAKAIAAFEKAAALKPEDQSTRAKLALAYFTAGQSEAAVAILGALLEENPDNKQLRVLKGLAHLDSADLEGVTAIAAFISNKQPDDPWPYSLIGMAQFRIGDMAAAELSYRHALELDGNYVPALFNLAQLAIANGRNAEADDYFARILKIAPDHLNTLIALSTIARKRGNLGQALSRLERVVELAPKRLDPRLELVSLLVEARQTERAVTTAEELYDNFGSDKRVLRALGLARLSHSDAAAAAAAFHSLARLAKERRFPPQEVTTIVVLQLQANDLSGAEETLNYLLVRHPDFVPAQGLRVEIAIRRRDLDGALEIARSVADSRQDLPLGQIYLGDVLTKMGRDAEAAEAYRRSLEIVATALAAKRLFLAYRRDGRVAEAVQFAQDWLTKQPGDRDLRLLLAAGYQAMKRHGQAIALLEQLRQETPRDPSLLNNLAVLYSGSDDALARRYAEDAYELASDNPGVLDTLGWILVQDGELQRGLKLLRQARYLGTRHPELSFHLAVALERLERYDEAMKEVEIALQFDQLLSDLEAALALRDSLKKRQ